MIKIKLPTQIFLGLVLGIIAGVLLGEKVLVLQPIGDVFLRLITMIV
ncbi:MAG: cation:dicarboxylase symporter family transporter, partial [Candidatus Aminicenantes bacterium]|nr:cation:dicarboxylase symporter family transporter [Candidatus Aminicenantes bacterium]